MLFCIDLLWTIVPDPLRLAVLASRAWLSWPGAMGSLGLFVVGIARSGHWLAPRVRISGFAVGQVRRIPLQRALSSGLNLAETRRPRSLDQLDQTQAATNRLVKTLNESWLIKLIEQPGDLLRDTCAEPLSPPAGRPGAAGPPGTWPRWPGRCGGSAAAASW